jgi:hypothetical protein
MSLSEAFAAALAALSASGNGERTDVAATQLEVAILDRTRDHRAFRRIRAARLAELISESRSAGGNGSAAAGPGGSPPAQETAAGPSAQETPPSGSGPATGPSAGGTDRGSGLAGGGNGTPPNPL